MTNKISYSKIRSWSECGRKYELHYKHHLRSKFFHAALAFGSAIDKSLNTLLETRDVEKARAEFDKQWAYQYVNSKNVRLVDFVDLVYAETDFDGDLLLEEDWQQVGGKEVLVELDRIRTEKKEKGLKNLDINDRLLLNKCNWLCLRRKGYIMLHSYNEKIMPHIREVKAVQYETFLNSDAGDQIQQFVDLIVEWEDGSIILFDNKTSARKYEEGSAAISQQLISYYYQCKEQFNIGAIGYIVLNKHINKNKDKFCTKCGKKSDNNRVKTCAIEVDGVRCGGEFREELRPECFIQVIVDQVSDNAVDLVLSTFDEANHGIKNEMYYKNLLACKNGPIVCEYFGLCWHGDDSDLVVVPEYKKE